MDAKGRKRYRLVESCDFITSVGHRSACGKTHREMGYRGLGPDWLVTELGVFDFDESGQARLALVYPDTDIDTVRDNTGFDFPVREDLRTVALPSAEMVAFIRGFDPMKIHERELARSERSRRFPLLS